MELKILASQYFIEKLEEARKNSWQGKNPERYRAFLEVFGKENFGFILAGDVHDEINTGKKVNVYKLDNTLKPYLSSEKGIGCKVLLANSFSIKENSFPTKENIEKIISYLDVMKEKGVLGEYLNSRKGILSEDKVSILELKTKGIPIPNSIHFESFQDLEKFIERTEEEYIIKHRFGQEGFQLERINRKNISNFSNWQIKDYLVQEKLNILNEKRLIFFGNEFLGARVIYDRTMPWEVGKNVIRKHYTEPYSPSKEDIKETRDILNIFDARIGCVDWIETKEKGKLYLEYNGTGTGFGRGEKPYNLNKEVAKRVKNQFL
jgi:glutathione synthase/RimK-type ligase-like ATP-grasp enzyme